MIDETENNTSEKEWREDRRAYLGILQQNIARVNENSRSVKSLCIAICSAFIALYKVINSVYIFIFSLAIIACSYIMDFKYLELERKFRDIYNRVVSCENPSQIKLFEINLEDAKADDSLGFSFLIYLVLFMLNVIFLLIEFLKKYCFIVCIF